MEDRDIRPGAGVSLLLEDWYSVVPSVPTVVLHRSCPHPRVPDNDLRKGLRMNLPHTGLILLAFILLALAAIFEIVRGADPNPPGHRWAHALGWSGLASLALSGLVN